MLFYERLKRILAVVKQFFARYRMWLWGIIVLPAVVCVMSQGVPSKEISLIIHNKTDRHIQRFSINGMEGGSVDAYRDAGRSKATIVRGGSIRGKTVEVDWTFNVTKPQYNAGLRPERRRIYIPMPERRPKENALHVHFYSDDRVLLKWGRHERGNPPENPVCL